MTAVRLLVGVLGAALVALNLTEFFITFLLPRRVKRDPRLARGLNQLVWRPFRGIARRLSPGTADTMLGLFGPLALVVTLIAWTIGIVVGFGMLEWAGGSRIVPHGHASFWNDLYFSAGAFVSASSGLEAVTAWSRVLLLCEAAAAIGVLFVVIGYLPSLYQAFSQRETVVSQLDPRAGSPPTAATALVRSAHRGGWDDVAAYLGEWDDWAAELMETHLAYPILSYYRSQHLNQNWLAAMTTVLDTSAFTRLAHDGAARDAAELTYAIARHALADLTYTFGLDPAPPAEDRLPPERLDELLRVLAESGLAADEARVREHLPKLRERYEPYANALSEWLVLPLPLWVPAEKPDRHWRDAIWGARDRVGTLP